MAQAEVVGASLDARLVGRAAELEQLVAVLGAARIVTIVGGPGVGKTALAETAAGASGDAVVVRLTEVAPGAPVEPAIAAACGVREQPGQPVLSTLAIALAGRDRLLVLDGADDVRDALAPVVDQLRIECPRVRIVVTARMPVRYRHELVLPIGPLDGLAARVLAQRHAGASVTDVELDDLVARSGGSPLALVLGARALADGRPAVAGVDAVDSAVDAVLAGLGADALDVAALLSLLPAGASSDGIGGAADLDALVDAGLVVADSSPPATRYRLIGPARDAVRRSVEVDVAHRQRMALLQSTVERLGAVLTPTDERIALDALERELPNLAAAVEWACVEGNDPDGGAELASEAARVCLARARFDDGTRLVNAARRAGSPQGGRLAYYAGAFAQLAGRLADAAAAFDETEMLGRAAGDDTTTALGLVGRATIAFFTGDRAGATSLAAAAAEHADASGDDVARMNATSLQATLARIGGDLEAADAAYAATVAIARRVRDHRSLATALLGHGSVAQLRGALDDAGARIVEAREVARAAGHPAQLAAALGTLGALAEAGGNLQESRRLLVEAMTAADAAGEHRTRLETLVNLGGCEIDLGDHAAARQHLGDALALARRLADRRLAAFALAGLAECALVGGDVAAAARLEREALSSRRALGDRRALALSLEETAAIVAAGNHLDEVPALLAAASDIRSGAGLARSASEAARVARVQAMCPPQPVADTDLERVVDRAIAVLDDISGEQRATSQVSAANRHVAAGTAVRTLGGFAVEVDGTAVAPESWGSRRARQLVKLLVAGRGRPVAREQLAAALWPDATPDEEARLGARLSVLLSTVRKVLGPAAVTADRAAVAIDLDVVDVDVEHLFAAIGADDLDAVVDRYAGDFLPEDVYEEWSTGVREQARLGFLDAARRLARASAAEGAHERAAQLCLRTLDADPYDDDAHRLLVGSLAAAGRHGEADRAYQLYAARMNELGIEPPAFADLTTVAELDTVAVRR